MARPLKEGLDYFPHDTDAANDEKIEALRALYGNDGYAFYFILLERIYRTPAFEIDISDAETIQILARKIGITDEKFRQILTTAIKWDCFDRQVYEEKSVLTSRGVKRRADVVIEKRKKMRSKYYHNRGVSDAETGEEMGEETGVSDEFLFRAKVKKSKVKYKDMSYDISAEKKTTPEVKRLIDYYFQSFFKKFGEKPVIDGKKDGAIIKGLCRTYGEEKLKGLLDRFFESTDLFIVSSGYTVGVFKTQVNKLIADAQRPAMQNLSRAMKSIYDFAHKEDNCDQ